MKKATALLMLATIMFRLFAVAGGAEMILEQLLPGIISKAEETNMAQESLPEPSDRDDGKDAIPVSAPTEAIYQVIIPELGNGTQEEETAVAEDDTEILSTTIRGGLMINNSTGYEPDIGYLLSEGTNLNLPSEGPQILIIHTHGSEAYAQDAFDKYVPSDISRTQDKEHSVIRVGDELTTRLESFGLNVLHDREIYDYPSYTGSYNRSQTAIENYLEQYPNIAMVIDLHRDALGTGDVIYKTIAEVAGETSSQLMLLVGTGENGLYHPHWQENLKLALTLQRAVDSRYPTLARPVALKQERYNQHLTKGSLILEVGSSGNTLREAICAVRLFADAIGDTLLSMVAQ